MVDFPMFEYDEKEKRLKAQHHPFTKPRLERLEDLKEKPLELGTYAYDLVLNGVELGSGSLRISDPQMQEAVFEALGLDEEQIKVKFGFLVEAMDYGIPPHGGIGLGLDRTVMLMAGEIVHPRSHRLPEDRKRLVPAHRRPVARSLPSSCGSSASAPSRPLRRRPGAQRACPQNAEYLG